jgi:hypothetical protein
MGRAACPNDGFGHTPYACYTPRVRYAYEGVERAVVLRAMQSAERLAVGTRLPLLVVPGEDGNEVQSSSSVQSSFGLVGLMAFLGLCFLGATALGFRVVDAFRR